MICGLNNIGVVLGLFRILILDMFLCIDYYQKLF